MASSSLPLRRYAAELLGAFLLTFAVFASVTFGYPGPTPVIAAVTLGGLVYILGSVSGAHLNPAVTVGLWSLKKINARDAGFYIVSQLIGAILAYLLMMQIAADAPSVEAGPVIRGVIGEAIGAFTLVFGVSAVVHGKVADAASGLAIGLALFTGIMVAAALSLGVLNPAVALGLGVFMPSVTPGMVANLVVYAVTPLIAGVLAAQAAGWMFKK